MCIPSGSSNMDLTLVQPAVLKDCHSLCRCCRPFSMAIRSGLSLLTVDDVHRTPPWLLKVATGSESSGVEFGILEDERWMHRHRSLSATLPRARVGFRLQSIPTAAPADQPHYSDSVAGANWVSFQS